MFNRTVHILLIICYVSLGVGLGATSYWLFDYSAAISTCLGGMFTLGCGLLHVGLAPRKIRMPREIIDKIDTRLDEMRDAQNKAAAEIARFKDDVIEEARQREEKLTAELKEIAIGIAQFAQRVQSAQTAKIADAAPKRSERNLLHNVQEAIEQNRVELHLQPVVTLPQRRISFYECYTRLRDANGGLILPGEFLRVAEHSGLVAEIDNMLLLKCVQLARKMIKRDRRMSLFCNLSPTSLADENFFGQFMDFLRENRDLTGSIIFELTRDAFDRLSMTAERNMGRLFDLGFRFSIDRCAKVDLDLRKLERMGVRYVKIAGDMLVKQLVHDKIRPITGLAREFDAEDVASLFARYGVDLIADRVENERTVVEILDLDLGFAQGNLFGTPKPENEWLNNEDDLKTNLRRLA